MLAFLVAGGITAAPAQAQSFEHRVYLDLDSNPATGCSVVTAAGTVSGAEARLTATVTGQPPQVTAVTRETCVGAAFSAPQPQAAGYAVGLDNGIGGSDVVEFATPLAGLGSGGVAQLTFVSSSATGADLVAAGGFALPGSSAVPTQPIIIPATGLLTLLLLAGAVFWIVRRHPGLGSSMALLLLLGAGVVWAAGFITDGQVGDWVGEPMLASDPNNDSTSAESPIEVVAVFAGTEAGRLFLRVDVSDAEPPTNIAPVANDAAFSLAENSAIATAVGTVVATDADAGQTLSYAITAGNTGTAFAIDAAGNLTVANTAALDFETTPVFNLTVTVTDDGSPTLSDTAAVTVTLTDVNEAPVLADAARAVPEDSPVGTAVGAPLGGTDPDTTAPNNTLTYAITAGNTNNAFAIDNAGQLTVLTASEVATPGSFSLSVSLTDGGGLSDSATIAVTVSDQNDPPQFGSPSYAFTLPENSAAATAVGSAPATDPDAGQALTYAITAGNTGNAFAIDAAGNISVATSAALDFETTPLFNLTITVTDDGVPQLSDTASVAITLGDVNEAPVATDATFALPENSANATVVGTVVATDPDTTAPNNTLGYAITAGNAGNAFAIDANSGQITVADGTQLNFELLPTFNLTVTVTDGGALSDTASITVNLTDVNDAPVLADAARNVAENSPAGTLVGSPVTGADEDTTPPNNTLGYAITGGNTGNAFAIDANSGQISVQTAAAVTLANSPFALIVTVTDGGGLSDSATVTITVTDINDAPSFTAGANQMVNEDAGAQTVVGWATAIDDGDPAVVQNLTFNITGNTNPGLFATVPAVSPSGDLTFTPAADANGSASITLVLMDDGGTANGGVDTSPPQNFTITVTAVNDAPVFSAGPDPSVLENAGPQTINPWATGLSAGPADEAGQTLVFNITGNTNPALFSAGPAVSPSGVLTFTPAVNVSGTATITLALMDNGGTANGGADTSAAQMFTITVLDVNAAPVFTAGANQTVDEDAGAQTVNGWATGIDDGDPGVTQNLTFNVTGNTNPALFSAAPAVSSTGVLTYTPAANASGAATITLVLMDDGGTANGGSDTSAPQMFTITLNPVNDPPTATVKSHTTHSAIEFEIVAAAHTGELLEGAADVDDPVGDLTAVLVAGSELPAGAVVTVTNASDGSFRYDPPGGYSGAGSFQFRICDDGVPVAPQQCSAATTVTFNITGPELWFVDDSAAAGGDGGLNDPFDSIADLPGARGTGDRIYLFSGTYANAHSINADEHLIGQGHSGASAALLGVVPVANGVLDTTPAAGAAPSITNTVTFGGNNALLRGVAINSGANTGVSAGAVSNITALETSINAATATAVNFNGTDASPSGVVFASTTSGGGTNGIVLNNVTDTFDFGSGALSGHSGVSFLGTGTLGTTSYGGSISKTSPGNVVELSGAAPGTATLSGTIACNSSCAGIDVLNRGAGTITFSGASKVLNTGANAAVNLDNNDAAQIHFTGGGLDIDTTSGAGFNAVNGATQVTVQGTNNTIASGTGTALNVVGTTIGAPALNFQSIASTGGVTGIVLNTTGAQGGLTVTGNGGACSLGTPTCSGGTLQGHSGAGIDLLNTRDVNLALMRVTGGGDDGIRGNGVVNFSLNNSVVSANGNAVTERGLDFTNLTGSATLSGSALSGNAEDHLVILNTSGTLNPLTITGSGGAASSCQVVDNSTAIGNDGIQINAQGSANIVGTITGCRFDGNRGDHVQVLTDAVAGSTQVDVVLANNLMSADRGTTYGGTDLGGGITISPSGNAVTDVDLSNHDIQGAVSSAINYNLGTASTGAARLRGLITGATVGATGTVDSGSSQADAVTVATNGGGVTTVAITNNTLRQYSNLAGINLAARDSMGTTNGALNVTATGNSIAAPGTFASNGIVASSGATSIDNYEVCLNIGGAGAAANTVNGSGANGGTDLRVRHRFEATVQMPGYAGGQADTAAVNAYLIGRNNTAPTVSSTVNTTPPVGGQFQNTGACPMPP